MYKQVRLWGCLLALGLAMPAYAQRALPPGGPFYQIPQGPGGWGPPPPPPGGWGPPPPPPGGWRPPPPPPGGGWGMVLPPIYVIPSSPYAPGQAPFYAAPPAPPPPPPPPFAPPPPE